MMPFGMDKWQWTAVPFSDRLPRMGKQTEKFCNESSLCSNTNCVIVAELWTMCLAHLFSPTAANLLTAYEAVTSETKKTIPK